MSGLTFAGENANISLAPTRLVDNSTGFDAAIIAAPNTVSEIVLKRMSKPSQEQADNHVRYLVQDWYRVIDGSVRCVICVFVSGTCSHKRFQLIIGDSVEANSVKGVKNIVKIEDFSTLGRCFSIGPHAFRVNKKIGGNIPRIRNVALELVAHLCK